VTDIDLRATQAALRAAASRTAVLFGSVTDPGAPVPGLDWTVAETAAHLVGDIEQYTGYVTGERDARQYLALAGEAETPSDLSIVGNARMLEEFGERDLTRLGELVVSRMESFIAAADRRAPDELVLTEAGLKMTVPMMSTALLGEQLVHGYDIARALKAPWPISREVALLVIAGIMALAPEYVDPRETAGLHVAYELRFRGGPRYRLAIDDGTATIGPAGGKVDCWISADPVAFLLVGYGRRGQWGATLRGQMVAGGRKPWLALKFSKLLMSV
jgi:uncharacterized protein (TIGR03083 family)